MSRTETAITIDDEDGAVYRERPGTQFLDYLGRLDMLSPYFYRESDRSAIQVPEPVSGRDALIAWIASVTP